MNFIQGILSERIINSLGWTILHSLWQGLLIGSLLTLLLFIFRNHNAIIRYNLSVFSLVFIFGLSVMTFTYYFNGEMQSGSSEEYSAISLLNDNKESNSAGTGQDVFKMIFTSAFRSISDTLPGKFPLITGLWLLGVFIVSMRMAGGIFFIQKLRSSCLDSIPEHILERFKKLSRVMNVRKKVLFCESYLIKVPSVLGYFKPMILLPVSAVTYIPVEQLEAIVAHELAHIRRHDWLVNMFQSAMEALFFYHPVVWLIQKNIRKERENCCDDIALTYSDGQVNYIKALASINEIPSGKGFPLLALNSGKYHLLNRVLRILKKGKMKTNLKDRLLAGLVLASATAIILLSTGGRFVSISTMPVNPLDSNSTIQPVENSLISEVIQPAPVFMAGNSFITSPVRVSEPETVTPPLPVTVTDTTLKIKDNVVQRTFFRNGKEMDMKMRIEKGKVTELIINGEKIPEKDYEKYQPEIDQTLADVIHLEEDLSRANEQLSQLDMEKIRMDVQKSMYEAQEKIKEIDVEAMVERLENIQVPEIEQAMKEIQSIDTEKIRAEMEIAMQSLCEEMKKIELPDAEQLKQEIEKARQEMAEIDHEKIQFEIQEAMKDIQIDKEKLRKEIEKSLQEVREIDMDNIKKDFENEKVKMDQMLKEIEKLELEKK